MEISQALSRAAQEAGMTDVDIASAVEVSQMTVSRWLTGKTEPKGQHVFALIRSIPGFGRLMGVGNAA